MPVLCVARVSAATPLSACRASCGSTRSAAAWLVDWWPTRTISVPGVTASLGPLTVDQCLKWLSKAQSVTWRPLSAFGVTCCAPVGALTVPLPPGADWHGESSGNYCLYSPPITSLLRCMARCSRPMSTPLWSTVAKCWDRITPTSPQQRPHHDPLDLWHQRPRWNILSLTTQETRHTKGITTVLRSRTSMNVAWLALTRKTEKLGEPVLGIAWCCHPPLDGTRTLI